MAEKPRTLPEFNLEKAFVTLRQDGLSDRQAVNRIKDHLVEQTGFRADLAMDQGFSDEMVIAHLIGRSADDLEPSRLKSLGRGVASGLIQEGMSSLAGVASYKGAGLALQRLAQFMPMATPYTFAAKAGLGILGAGLMALSDAPEEVEEAVLGKRQVLPTERGYVRSGEVIGGTAAYIYPTRKLLQKIPTDPKDINLGSKMLMRNHLRNRNSRLSKGEVDLEKIPKTPKFVKGLETFEKVIAGAGASARQRGPLRFASSEVGGALMPAFAEGVIVDTFPGNETLATLGGLTAAVFDPFKKAKDLAVAGVEQAGIAKDIKEKGFVGSLKTGFGVPRQIKDIPKKLQEKREDRALAYLLQTLQDAGEDPQVFVAELRDKINADPQLAEVLTPGQLMDHPVILLAEKTFAKGRNDLTQAQKNAALDGAKQITDIIQTLKATDNIDALRIAGQLEREAFETQLIGFLDKALYRAAQAADRVIERGGPNNVKAEKEASQLVNDAAEQALTEARKFEEKLYEKVDATMLIDTSPILQMFEKLKDPASPGGAVLGSPEKLPEQTQGFLRTFGYRFPDEPPVDIAVPMDSDVPLEMAVPKEIVNTATLSDVLAFRRYIQRQLRAAETGEAINKAIFGPLDQAALDAMGVSGPIEDMTPNSKNLREAYNFSKKLHDVFLRSYTGDLTRSKRNLTDLILPEEALGKVFRQSLEKQTTNLEALREGFQFVDEITGGKFQGTLNSAVDSFLRQAFRKQMQEDKSVPFQVEYRPGTLEDLPLVKRSFDPDSPDTEEVNVRLNKNQLQRLIYENSQALEIINDDLGLLGDLKNIDRAQVALETAFAKASNRAKTNNKQILLSQFLQSENAASVLSRILSSKKPNQSVRSLAAQINKSPVASKDLKDGLYATLLDDAISNNSFTNKEGDLVIQFEKMYDYLFDTKKAGLQGFGADSSPIMNLFLKNKLIEKDQFDKLQEFMVRGRNLDRARQEGIDALIQVPENDAMKDLVSRMAGAQGIAILMRNMGLTPTIQTTGAGAQFIKNQFSELPTVALRDILVDVTQPGKASVLADFLERTVKKDQVGKLNPIYRYIGRTLLGSPSYVAASPFRLTREEDDIVQPPPVMPQQAAPAINQSPRPSFQNIQPPAQPAAPPPQTQAAPPNPQLRQRYAAMYPNDPISGLIEQQAMQTGIGTLPT